MQMLVMYMYLLAGGPNSAQHASNLLEEVYNLFYMARERIFKDDVTLLLDDAMEVNFNAICEDESTDEVGM